MSFHALELHPTLLRGVEGLGYLRPTPIQNDAIPPALAGRDVLACAATGSGKTTAFLLPILQQLLDRPKRTTRALILAPTRELAQQIVGDFGDLARFTGLRAAAVHGGVGMGPQEKAFRQGAEVIVATPGRLLDHFRRDYAALRGLEYLVLDEADRMLDMGFLPDIRRVLAHIPRPKQILFFSATMPAPIEALTREILRSPVNIALQRGATPSVGVTHSVYPVRAALKAQLLVHMLEAGHIDEALVFTRTKHRADRLTKHLIREGISADRLHGNRSQAQRTRALGEFKAGSIRVLVATDIAARGIDVEALGHVVNFDVPVVPEDYVHRVGRTARAGATGEAYTFAAPEESSDVARIERAIGSKLPRARLAGFAYEASPEDPPLEIPLQTRIAGIRAQRASQPARSSAVNAAGEREGANQRRGARRRRFGRRRG